MKRRRTLTRSAVALAAAALIVGALPAAAETPPPEPPGLGLAASVEDLGVVASARNVRIADAGVLPDGTPVLYAFSDGNPVSFNVINADDGGLIATFPIPPKSVGGAITVAADGTAYFAARDGRSSLVYRYNPAANDIEFLAESPTGDSVTRSLEIGEDGILYGSTYPNAKVWSLDPATGEVRDYGSVATDDKYAWGFEKVGGTLYAGTGIGNGHVVTVDIGTGEMTELEIPEASADLTYFYDFQQVGDLVAMVHAPVVAGTDTLFWDTVSGGWVCEGAIPQTDLNKPFTTQTPYGVAYFRNQGEIWAFDSTDCSVEPTGWRDTGLARTGSHRTLDLVTLGEGDGARTLLLGMNNDGSFWRFDPDTGEHAFFESQVVGVPLTAHSVHAGPDGRVYAGTYLGPGVVGRYDPATDRITELRGPGQADSWVTHGDQLLVGSYPDGIVHLGDPAQPWQWGANPRKVLELIGHGQDRPIDMASDGELVAVGTVSDYGLSGGALTLTDLGGTVDVYRDLVPKQSVTSLAFGQDDLLYAGTSIRGGLSGENSTEDAHLVVFDTAAREVVHTVVPVPGNDVVAGLEVVDGTVWGVTTSGHVFGLDAATREVATTVDLGTGRTNSPWGTAATLQAHPTDGLLYGLSNGALFAFDPVTEAVQVLAKGGYTRMTIAETGEIYAIDATRLYRVAVAHPPYRCTAILTGAHEGPLRVTDGVTCAHDAEIDGPVTVAAGAGLALRDTVVAGGLMAEGAAVVDVGTSRIGGAVTITGTTAYLALRDSAVVGRVAIERNTTGDQPILVAGNTIEGSLGCEANVPAPTGTGNVVTGPKTGQCAGS